MSAKKRPESLGPLFRFVSLSANALDQTSRTVELSFSSNAPVDMWYGKEVLSHDRGAVRLDGQRQQSMPLLFNHDSNDVLGIVENVRLDSQAGKGYARVRFGKDARGDWAMSQVADGILTNVSFMYRVYAYDEDADTYTATDWEPYEVSLVTVPADASVGVGRSAGAYENAVEITTRAKQTADRPNEVRSVETETPATAGATPANAGNVVDLAQIRAVAAEAARTAATDAARLERERVLEIEAITTRHNLGAEFSREHVIKGTAIELVRGAALLALQARGEQKPASGAGALDMTAAERGRWSLIRAVNAALSGDWSRAGFERETSEAISKQVGREPRNRNAFFMPADIGLRVPGADPQQRAPYQVGTASQGGNLVATKLLPDNFIEYLRNASVTARLGANVLSGLVGNIDIPSQTGTSTTYWVGESSAATESEATFGKVSLRPKTVAALSKMSRLMLLQSTPAIEALARQDLFAQGALAIDSAVLYGSGSSSQPTGIANQSGVGSVVGGANGAAFTFDHFIQLYSAPRVANAPQAALAFAINAKTYGYLSTLKDSSGRYLWLPQGGGVSSVANAPADSLRGYPYAVSNQLRATLTKGTSSGNCSEALWGNWQEVLIGEWGVNEIMANPYDSTGFTTGDVLLRMFQTIDVGVRHSASFAYMSDGLTPGF